MTKTTKVDARKGKSREVVFAPKYSKKLVEFIVDKIEEGMTLAEVCREYSTVVPVEKSLYRWKKKYPEFKKAVDDAYQTLIFKMMDEMNDLSKQAMMLGQALKETLDMGDTKQESIKLKGEMDGVKIRIKALEFMLTRIAPKLVPDLQDTKADTVASLPPITIINFADLEPKDVPIDMRTLPGERS